MTRRSLACLLIVALLSPVAVAVASAGADTPEFNGTWKALSAEYAGVKWPQKMADAITLVLKDGKYTVVDSGKSDEGTVEYDMSKSPKTMVIKGTNGPNKGKTFLAIYEQKGEELRVCYDLSGKSYPTEFATKADTKLFLVTYRKAKP